MSQREKKAPRRGRPRNQGTKVALLEATLPFAADAGIDPRTARHWRVAGWKEMAYLMRLRSNDSNVTRADRAALDIDRRLNICRQLILPS